MRPNFQTMIASGETMAPANRTAPAPKRTELRVRGMTCQNCARHVREALQAVPGVTQAAVDLEAESAGIRWSDEAQPDIEAAVQAVVEAGYEAGVAENRGVPGEAKQSIWSGWGANLVVGVPVTLVLVLGEWIFHLVTARWFQWLAFALATVVQVIGGARFYRGAWLQIKARSSNMDTLVALGSTTAYGYSIWALMQGTHVYFMEAAAIITLVSVGHWLESRMSRRAASSMKKLLSLAPSEARRQTTDGREEFIPISELRVGDVVVLRPGERVPIDGAVLEGTSSVDEAMLTGESMPVDKFAGAVVYGGTVNLNSRLVVRVTATGESTALAQIIAAVERAQNSRANIQRLGDRVSSVFVPIVVLVALATGLWWGLAPESARGASLWLATFLWPITFADTALALAVVHAAAVLIIACPCAMGLATPVAIMAGTNAAAERGILIRDGIALEKAGTIDTIVFDKTGTLTEGKPTVTAHQLFTTKSNVPEWAASMAAHSNHPLSAAIAKWNEARTAESASSSRRADAAVRAPIEHAGAGLEASLDGQALRLGSLNWLMTSGVDLSAAQAFITEWTSRGASIVALAIGREIAAAFAIQDSLKPGIAEVLQSLQRTGHAVYLVTGDNRRTANAVALSLGIATDNVAAEVRPENKAEFVKSLQSQGKHVAFVGDGINDAPALEQADLGIAVGRATDIAKMAADIVLLKSDVHAIPESLGLARATLRTIKQNLFWAFFYNAAAIPLAALGFLSPVLCALTMGLSDVVVIGNALRLKRWRG
ncbi:MAG TPA: cation-translocating P-type ATPase [Candidatus Acidoferrum sp.]|nr:cation-translocating P-type ATPase [Candidatus Acidoferrum sp.]